jgi:serine/threonine protein kinase
MELLDQVGRYRVRELIGTGAFCAVYLAHDEALDDVVAVKVLADNWSFDLDVRSRFIDEARFLRRVRSEHLIRVHDIGETADGRPYFVMDYAEGGSVEQRLRRQSDDAPAIVDGEDVLAIARALARGLADLHREGIVHRDVKPSNLLVRSSRRDDVRQRTSGRLFAAGDRILLADMGLAKDLAAASGLTVHAGSPGYMAPEQRNGAQIDGRADIYAATAVILRLLSGASPGVGTRPVIPNSIDPAVARVLRRGLAHDPSQRHADADQWLAELEHAFATHDAGGAPSSPPARRHRRKLVAAGVGAVAAVGVVVAFAGASTSSDGPQAAIVGPSVVDLGTRATYQAQSSDAVSFFWTDWNGAIIEGREFWLQPTAAGKVRFRLTAVDPEGDTTTVSRTVELRDPTR